MTVCRFVEFIASAPIWYKIFVTLYLYSIFICRDPSEELVVLLVSDPQLIGIQDELGFPVGTITRWDSDR